MKRKLTAKETITITSMLFGMFFGAGNLIFPVYMGQHSGSNVFYASLGFLITGVGLPLLGVAALGISHSNGLYELACRVGKRYGIFFTCLLYLTIGPFFAIPRCATVPFSIGIAPMVENRNLGFFLAGFSLVFFAVVLWFSLRPGNILTWIGKVLNPIFLMCLAILCVTALLFPIGKISTAAPSEAYASGAFFKGFLEGYHTMDALAGLAFGIVVVNVIKKLGIEDPKFVAINTVKAGVFSCLMMGIIYLTITIIGAQSRGTYPPAENGGEALRVIANHYFGTMGAVILAITVTFACLKTAVGLITSCSEAFVKIFPSGPKYTAWAIIFCIVSFLIANLGLNSIIEFSMPVLMLLYPLSITLIILSFCGRFFNNDKTVYICVTVFTMIAAAIDFMRALPERIIETAHIEKIINVFDAVMPFADIGLGWILPAFAGLVIGLAIRYIKKI